MHFCINTLIFCIFVLCCANLNFIILMTLPPSSAVCQVTARGGSHVGSTEREGPCTGEEDRQGAVRGESQPQRQRRDRKDQRVSGCVLQAACFLLGGAEPCTTCVLSFSSISTVSYLDELGHHDEHPRMAVTMENTYQLGEATFAVASSPRQHLKLNGSPQV